MHQFNHIVKLCYKNTSMHTRESTPIPKLNPGVSGVKLSLPRGPWDPPGPNSINCSCMKNKTCWLVYMPFLSRSCISALIALVMVHLSTSAGWRWTALVVICSQFFTTCSVCSFKLSCLASSLSSSSPSSAEGAKMESFDEVVETIATAADLAWSRRN